MLERLKDALKDALPEHWVAHLQAADHFLRGEPELRMLRFLCPRRVAVDVGANIGTYTYFLRRHAKCVIAYEPNPTLAIRLDRLYPDVVVRAVALSDRAGTMKLTIPVIDGRPAHALGSVAPVLPQDATLEYEVSVNTLDAENIKDLGFLKVDAVQHDTEVIKGALATIARYRPVILTQVAPLLYPEPLPEHFAFLTRIKYNGWFRFRGDWLPFHAFDAETHAKAENFGRHFMDPRVIFLPSENETSCAQLTTMV